MATKITSQIALRIAGTKERKAGFASFVTVGVLAGNEGDNMDRTTLILGKPTYVIKHTANYVLYLLIDRNVKSFDADASGVLSVALTIASDMQLAGGVSPYTLLQEVYKTFVSTYMVPLSDGRDSFLNADVDNDIFRKIVSNYPLEQRNTAYVTMSNQGLTGVVCVSGDKMEDFFRDTQYREFAQYKDIEVGVNCSASPGLADLQIPRPVGYEVYVNGKPTGKVLSDVTEPYFAEEKATRQIEYIPVSFTLQEVFSAPHCILQKEGARIELDAVKGCIGCKLAKSDIYYSIVVNWGYDSEEEKAAVESFIANGRVKILLDGADDISDIIHGNSTILAGSVNKKIDITPREIDNYRISIQRFALEKERILRVTISISKRIPKPIPARTDRNVKPLVNDSTSRSQAITQEATEQKKKPVIALTNVEKSKSINIKLLIIGIVIGVGIGLIVGTVITGNHYRHKLENSKDSLKNSKESIENQKMADSKVGKNVVPASCIEAGQNPETNLSGTSEIVLKPGKSTPITSKSTTGTDSQSGKKTNKDNASTATNTGAKKESDAKKIQEQLLKLVNDKNLKACQKLWKKVDEAIISKDIRYAIEHVLGLNMDGALKKKLKNYSVKIPDKFESLDDVVFTSDEIVKCQNNSKPNPVSK